MQLLGSINDAGIGSGINRRNARYEWNARTASDQNSSKGDRNMTLERFQLALIREADSQCQWDETI